MNWDQKITREETRNREKGERAATKGDPVEVAADTEKEREREEKAS